MLHMIVLVFQLLRIGITMEGYDCQISAIEN